MTTTRFSVIAAGVLALAACASAPHGEPGREGLTLSIQNLVCSDCGKELEAKALGVSGVKDAHFDSKRSELQLHVARETAPGAIIAALESEPVDGRSIRALVGAGQGAYAPFATPEPGWDVKLLSVSGEDFPELGRAAAQGKVTVVDFSAEWCGPCHLLDEHMHELLSKDRDLAYRRVNVVDWDSPVAKHYLRQVEALPYVVVLDPKGHEVAVLAGATAQRLDEAVRKAKVP